ncbi:MAG TPA: CHAT domain-containing tetratricopeptide repeat protein [Bryobacteraceae bacterium]|nr:CHAT domain-containing tetratricopeptide repeat protein [Bryobacteraceae bacterium]
MRKALLARLRRGPAEFNSGNFREAAARAKSGYEDAMAAHETQIATRFLNNLGGCRFALHQYQAALQAFLEARKLTEITGDEVMAGKLEFNISSLYSQLNQPDAAIQALDRAAAYLRGKARRQQLPRLLIEKAALRADSGHLDQAVALYREGVAAADQAGDLEMVAMGWNDLGFEFLEHHDLKRAEPVLLEAYRIRKLNRFRSIESSYRNLGSLRLEQGDIRAASVLLDLAVDYSHKPGGLRPTWEVHYARARVRLEQNRLRDAMEDLRVAARLADEWRRAAPTSDATRIGTENLIQRVYSALVDTGNRLYFETRDAALLKETFESEEVNRAASLRALLAEPRDWRRNLPPEYWETLRKLESAEAEALRTTPAPPAVEARIQAMKAELVRWESQAGSNAGGEIGDLLSRTRRTVGPDAVFLSFRLASPDSYLWAVSRAHTALYRLPPGPQIASLVEDFEKNIRLGNSVASDSRRLFQDLFGQLSPNFQKKSRWLLALDAQLFDLPFAALTTEPGTRAAFLVEKHSLQITSGAGMLAPPAGGAPRGPFVAVADPIYNEADPRWTAKRPAAIRSLFQARADDSGGSDLRFARLVGSGREAAACAAAWGGPRSPVLLEGVAASRRDLQAALRRHPAVLHLATHVLHTTENSGSGLVVLSLNRTGQPEVLSPVEVATWNLDGALVTLSGCSSGSADTLPATGLMGLTRACLAAGARAVVASRWPTLDDAGSIFLSFYRHLRAAPDSGPAVALQLAQIDMIHSNTWRSNPRYWSAYFSAGNQL